MYLYIQFQSPKREMIIPLSKVSVEKDLDKCRIRFIGTNTFIDCQVSEIKGVFDRPDMIFSCLNPELYDECNKAIKAEILKKLKG